MQKPKLANNATSSKPDISIKKIENVTPYFSGSQKVDITDPKAYFRFITKLERTIRKSLEYREYITFLKEEMDMNYCSFFSNINRDMGISIEVHHAPLTLFDITSIIYLYLLDKKGEVTDLDVCNLVMGVHYKGLVGLIPLSKTVHELVHNGELFIPSTKVGGDFEGFYKKYHKGFLPEQVDMLQNIIDVSKQINEDEMNPEILERNYTYLEIDGMTFPNVPEINPLVKKETA